MNAAPKALHARPTSTSLLIVEPNRQRCEGLVKGLLSTGRFDRVVGRRTIGAARRTVAVYRFDVALITSSAQDEGEKALDLVRSLITRPKPIRSLVIAKAWTRPAVIEAFVHGARGLLTPYDLELSLLSKAILCVHVGQIWANSQQLDFALGSLVTIDRFERLSRNSQMLLSSREREIAHFLSRGASNKEIGKALDISERTVKNHLRSIFVKIGVNSRVQAALKLIG